MDLFKFKNLGANKTLLTDGVLIDGYDSVRWTERYRDAGEFEIKAPLSSGLLDLLTVDSMISHAKTREVMIVEDQQVSEKKGSESELTISGRSFETYLENRAVGQHQAFPPAPPLFEYTLAAADSWDQAVALINDHVQKWTTIDYGDHLLSILAETYIVGSGTSVERIPSRGSVYKALLEILAVDDLGIRTNRRAGVSLETDDTVVEVYKGNDVSDRVIFSANAGDLDGVDYLWSNRKEKNAAIVTGRYVEVFVPGVSTMYYRRVMTVDGSEIDGSFDAVPAGADLTAVRSKMTRLGEQALTKQNQVNISRVDISDTALPRYRTDYQVGDIVTVDANYRAMAPMRVIEYVEIEDKTGASGHPTLALIED